MDLRQKLNNQAAPQPESDVIKSFLGGGDMQNFDVDIDLNKWVLLMPRNNSRRFLMIQNRGGDFGPCNVVMSFDRQVINGAFNIDNFYPTIAPTNAIYVYATDPNNTGSTSVNIQVIEG